MPIAIEEKVSASGPIRRHWFDDAFKTMCANSLSVPVPEAERFVVRTVQEAYPRIHDEKIRAEADVLLHEEVAHAQVHDGYNALIVAQGYAIAPFETFTKKLYSFLDKHIDLKTRLAVCLSAEYLTALTGAHIIKSEPFRGLDTDPRMRRLWMWHCLEELDHRGTAYNIYLHLGGGYFRRVMVMAVMTIIYFTSHADCLSSLLRQDATFTNTKHRDTDGFLFGKNGFYPAIFQGWLVFFKPGFHPSKDIHLPDDITLSLRHYHIEDDIVRDLQTALRPNLVP